MRRNNYVFLVGRILEYRERSITVQEEPLLLIELFLATDKPSISQPHPVPFVVIRPRNCTTF